MPGCIYSILSLTKHEIKHFVKRLLNETLKTPQFVKGKRVPGRWRGRNRAGLEQGRGRHRASGIDKGLFRIIRKGIDRRAQLLIDHHPLT